MTDILEDFNTLTVTVPWWALAGLLDGVDDTHETIDVMLDQPRVDAYLRTAGMAPEWKKTILVPIRQFITKHWFPLATRTRTDAEMHAVFYERRFSLLKLCVLALRFEQFNWNRFTSNTGKKPTPFDCPQALASFAADCVTFGFEQWWTIKAEGDAAHMKKCEKGATFLSKHYLIQFPAQ